jgi:hypothetical protein
MAFQLSTISTSVFSAAPVPLQRFQPQSGPSKPSTPSLTPVVVSRVGNARLSDQMLADELLLAAGVKRFASSDFGISTTNLIALETSPFPGYKWNGVG